MYRSMILSLAGLVGLFALVSWAAVVLLDAPCVGVADDRGYSRVMGAAGIERVEPLLEPGAFVQCRFATTEADPAAEPTGAAVVAWLAKHLDWGATSEPQVMDLRQVGRLYLLLTAIVFAAGVAGGLPSLLAVGFLLVLVDPGYLLFFNSFYPEPALLLAVVGTAVWFARIGPGGRVLPAGPVGRTAVGGMLLLLACLGGASGTRSVILPAAAAGALALVLVARRPDAGQEGREGREGWVGPVVLLAVLAAVAVAVPLHLVGAPAGADDGTAVEGRPAPDREARDGVGPAADDLRIQEVLSRPETHVRGNFMRSEEHTERGQLRVAWSFTRWRARLFGTSAPALWLVLGGVAGLVVIAAARRRWSGTHAAAAFLLLFAAGETVVVRRFGGVPDPESRLLGARLAFDLLLVVGLWVVLEGAFAAVRGAWSRARGRPEIRRLGGAEPSEAAGSGGAG